MGVTMKHAKPLPTVYKVLLLFVWLDVILRMNNQVCYTSKHYKTDILSEAQYLYTRKCQDYVCVKWRYWSNKALFETWK